MSIPKERTVAALEEVWVSLDGLLAELSDDEWRLPSPLPGWDVKDNVAHIIGTESMLAGVPRPDIDIDRDANPHVRNDIGASNEVWVEYLRGESPARVLARYREWTGRRLSELRSMAQQAWDAESFTPAGRSTLGRFIQIRVFDCWLHEQDIRDATGRPGNETGLAVEVTLDELATAMGFVVGKKAGVAPGQSVTFALVSGGVMVREIHVQVGERAIVVPSLDGPPTARLEMPIGVMTRLCGGRSALDDVRDSIAVTGDAAVGEAVLENLNYTI